MHGSHRLLKRAAREYRAIQCSVNATSLLRDGPYLLRSYAYKAIRGKTPVALSSSVGGVAKLKRRRGFRSVDIRHCNGHAWRKLQGPLNGDLSKQKATESARLDH